MPVADGYRALDLSESFVNHVCDVVQRSRISENCVNVNKASYLLLACRQAVRVEVAELQSSKDGFYRRRGVGVRS